MRERGLIPKSWDGTGPSEGPLRSPEEVEAFGVHLVNRFVEKALEGVACIRVQQGDRCNENDHARDAKGKQRASSQTSAAASTLILAETPTPTARCVQQEPTPGESATRDDGGSQFDGQESVLSAGVPAFQSSSRSDGLALGLLDNVDLNLELMGWTEEEWRNYLDSSFSLYQNRQIQLCSVFGQVASIRPITMSWCCSRALPGVLVKFVRPGACSAPC